MATIMLRPLGPTVALSVVATTHAAVPLAVAGNEMLCYAACLNLGTVAVAVHFSPTGEAAILPVDGTPGEFILPPLMTAPIVLNIPSPTVQVTAIGATAGPSLIYITPVAIQS
jgi:hypothetical protein